jgi:hypothetical protein
MIIIKTISVITPTAAVGILLLLLLLLHSITVRTVINMVMTMISDHHGWC